MSRLTNILLLELSLSRSSVLKSVYRQCRRRIGSRHRTHSQVLWKEAIGVNQCKRIVQTDVLTRLTKVVFPVPPSPTESDRIRGFKERLDEAN